MIFSVRFDQDNEILDNRKGSNLADIIAGEGPSTNYIRDFIRIYFMTTKMIYFLDFVLTMTNKGLLISQSLFI